MFVDIVSSLHVATELCFLFVLNSRWDTPTNKLLQQNKKLLGDILLDFGRPLCSHYGAIMGLLALGLDVRII